MANGGGGSRGGGGESDHGGQLRVIREDEVAYKRYLTVYDRRVQYPGGQEVAFDVVGHPRCNFRFVCVFGYDARTRSVPLLREYSQGANAWVWSLPCGGWDPGRHGEGSDGLLEAAKAELAEEARMEGTNWQRLLPDDHPGILEGKWCLNRFVPYACDVRALDAAGERAQRDAEELIEVHEVSVSRLDEIACGGDMLPPSVVSVAHGLRWLRETGRL